MKYKQDTDLFVEAADEYGAFEPTVEDAAMACRTYLDEMPGTDFSESRWNHCVSAVLSVARPGHWDHW